MAQAGRAQTVRTLGWIAVVLGPLAVSAILVLFRGESLASNADLLLVLPVLAAAIVGGRLGGVVSAVVAAVCFDFFFTRPYYSLTIDRRADIETTVVLLIVGLVVGELVNRMRASTLLARASRRDVEQIRRVAEVAAGHGRSGSLIHVVEREVMELLGARDVRFERPPYATTLPRLGHGVVTIGDNGAAKPGGPSNEIELPVWGRGREIGRLVLVLPCDSSSVVTLPADDRAMAVALVDQLGAVLAAATET